MSNKLIKELITSFPVCPSGFVEVIVVNTDWSQNTREGNSTETFEISDKRLINMEMVSQITTKTLRKAKKHFKRVGTSSTGDPLWDTNGCENVVTETLECFRVHRSKDNDGDIYVLFVTKP